MAAPVLGPISYVSTGAPSRSRKNKGELTCSAVGWGSCAGLCSWKNAVYASCQHTIMTLGINVSAWGNVCVRVCVCARACKPIIILLMTSKNEGAICSAYGQRDLENPQMQHPKAQGQCEGSCGSAAQLELSCQTNNSIGLELQ